MATAMLNARIWYDDMGLHTQANAVALETSAEELDATVLQDTTKIHAGGTLEAVAQIEGFWNGTEDATLFAEVSANHPLMVADGITVGNIAYGINGKEMKYNPFAGAQHGQLLRFSLSIANAGDKLVRGQLAFASQVSSSGNGTALNLGLVAAGQKIYSGLHVTQFDGTSLDVVIQGDAESAMGSPAGHITFAQATGLTSEWGSKAGAIADDDWWRVNYTFVGTDVTFAVFFGIS